VIAREFVTKKALGQVETRCPTLTGSGIGGLIGGKKKDATGQGCFYRRYKGKKYRVDDTDARELQFI
jgi:hypothetical protein